MKKLEDSSEVLATLATMIDQQMTALEKTQDPELHAFYVKLVMGCLYTFIQIVTTGISVVVLKRCKDPIDKRIDDTARMTYISDIFENLQLLEKKIVDMHQQGSDAKEILKALELENSRFLEKIRLKDN